MITIVVTGRNDDYGGDFENRLLRTARHNLKLLSAAGVPAEYLLCEWNPLPDRPPLARAFTAAFPRGRAVVVEPAVHQAYTLNPHMAFHEMAAKNAGIRRSRGHWILVTNADILLDDSLVDRLATGPLQPGVFYRAHRIDVPSHLEWPELKAPRHQLTSGEGRLPPPYYLGAGGDFVLAARDTWLRSTGFNEAVRWTTRAKDWQFFLGVAARAIPIQFLGDVYHLDHAQGFRRTPQEQRDSAAAHFGGNWDFEFGIPVTNREGWGLVHCREEVEPGCRITTLRLAGRLFTAAEEAEDRQWQQWLGPPSGDTDQARLRLLYAVLHAAETGRRLVIRPRTPSGAVAAAGLVRVARYQGLAVSCPWEWPSCSWANLPELPGDGMHPGNSDLLFEETAAGWELSAGGGNRLDPLPRRLPPVSPSFNPFLCRRLLRALLDCLHHGFRRIALFGAGGHSRELLRWGLPDWLDCRAILAGSGPTDHLRGIPVSRPERFDFRQVDAVVLSSVTYEGEMLETLSGLAPSVPVIPLYSDWPPGL